MAFLRQFMSTTAFLYLFFGCQAQKTSVQNRCDAKECGSSLQGAAANATSFPNKVPNAPEGAWRMNARVDAIDSATGLRKVHISWPPYPSAKGYQLVVSLDKECQNPIKSFNLVGIFYDQLYSKELLIESGLVFYACLSAVGLDRKVPPKPENSPLALSDEPTTKKNFSLVGPLAEMHTGSFKVAWTEYEGVVTYEVTVTDASGVTVQTSTRPARTPSGEALLAHEIKGLGDGKYQLRVTAADKNGIKVRALADGKNQAYEFVVDSTPVGKWSLLKPEGRSPVGRTDSMMASTPKGILIWGGLTEGGLGLGDEGMIFNGTSGRWEPMSNLGTPEPRVGPSALLTANPVGSTVPRSLFFVWGGRNFDLATFSADKNLGDGAVYDVMKDVWLPVPALNAPSSRHGHTITATDQGFLVWGGIDRPTLEDPAVRALESGGMYQPTAQAWTPLATANGEGRAFHCAVWTGSEVLVWGGLKKTAGEEAQFVVTGSRFTPASMTWKPMSVVGQPVPRIGQSCHWTGSKMLVWGGSVGFFALANGAAYDPKTDTWAKLADQMAPFAVLGEASIWTGRRLFVWGGGDGVAKFSQIGGLYDPETNLWDFVTLADAPSGRWGTQGVAQKEGVYLFGGDSMIKDAKPQGKIFGDFFLLSLP